MTTTTPSPTARLGRNVRAEMARRGLSQMALASRLGVTQAAVSRRLRGETPIDIDELVKIASHLNLTIDVLLEGVDA